MKTIDSIKPPARRPPKKPRIVLPAATGARFTAFTRTPRRRRAWGMVLVAVLSPILFGIALLGPVAGAGVAVVYGLLMLVRRWPSRVSFALALAALVYMSILQLAAAADLAKSMAALAYILLTVGAISLAIEVRMSNRVWFKKH